MKNGKLTDAAKEILSRVTAKEAKALKMRFGIQLSTDLTLDEVAKQFDVTRQKIKQIEEKALKKLRGDEDPDPNDDGPEIA